MSLTPDDRNVLTTSRRNALATVGTILAGGLAGCGDDLQEAAEKGDREAPPAGAGGETPARERGEEEKEELRDIANTQTETQAQQTSSGGNGTARPEYEMFKIPVFSKDEVINRPLGASASYIGVSTGVIPGVEEFFPSNVSEYTESSIHFSIQGVNHTLMNINDSDGLTNYLQENGYSQDEEIAGQPLFINQEVDGVVGDLLIADNYAVRGAGAGRGDDEHAIRIVETMEGDRKSWEEEYSMETIWNSIDAQLILKDINT